MSDPSQMLFALVPGTVIGGDYRIVRPLNEGGMGAVYVAEQLSTKKQRALKVMHPRLVPDARSRERFQEEASVGAHIPSEHVVEVIAAGVDEATGIPWLAMELLDGMDLDRVVREQSPLPREVVAEIFAQVGHALRAAHAQGIVHRDLKPENLFAARSRRSNASMTIKVLDFGIAKTVADAKTAATVTSAIGSPLWMAPEQGTPGAQLRPSTDVWALGLIAFYLLTERYYWPSANAAAISLQHLLVEVMVSPLVPASVRAAELGRGDRIPPGFDEWFARCVDRDPARRFGEAGAAADALRGVLAGAPRTHDGRTVALAFPPQPSSSVVATAVLAPRPRSSAGLIIGLALGGVATIAASALALVLVLQKPEPDAPPAPALASIPVAPSPAPPPAPVERREIDPVPEPAPSSEGQIPPELMAQIQRQLRGEEPQPAPEPPERTEERAPVPVERAERPREPVERHSPPQRTSRSGGDIDSLLDDALGPSPRRQPSPPSGDPNMPEAPSRAHVVSAMNGVQGAVSACGNGSQGTAQVRVVFAGSSGRVTSAEVTGQFAGTPTGSCIARAVRGAQVPPFRQPSFTVNYPFRL